MKRQIGWLAVAVGLVSASAVGGCSNSGNDGTSGDNETGGAAGAGGDGIVPVGGSGGGIVPVGSGGSGAGGIGAGGAFGAGGATAAAPVPCGSAMCTAPASVIPGFGPAACCADATTSTCGTSSPLMNGTCSPPPAPDTRCANSMTMFGTYTGCCTNNDCGLDLSSLGLGCVDTSSPMAGRFLGNTTPTHCDGTPFPMNTGGTTGGTGGATGSTGGRGSETGGRGGGSGGRGSESDAGPGGSGPGDASTSH